MAFSDLFWASSVSMACRASLGRSCTLLHGGPGFNPACLGSEQIAELADCFVDGRRGGHASGSGALRGRGVGQRDGRHCSRQATS